MTKQRISLTIDGNVLRKLDAMVDGETMRSRSEAVEKILESHLESNRGAEDKRDIQAAGGHW